MKNISTLMLPIALTFSALLAVPTLHAACDFSAASSTVQTLLNTDGITDGALLIGSPQGIWFKQFYGGNYSDATVIPIASASKMLSGVRIMQLVDQGTLALDTPVSSYGWKDNIGAPLCISTIDWQGLGTTQNYRISGSAQTSIGDYARVLAMLAGGGVGNGRRILSANAIATLKHSQTGNATDGYTPPGGAGSTQYGIGAWIEVSSVSTDAPLISSIGAFGFTPWVDFSNGTFGLIMVADRNSNSPVPPGESSHNALLVIIPQIRAQLQANNGTCPATAIYDNIFGDGYETSAPLPQCPGIVVVQ